MVIYYLRRDACLKMSCQITITKWNSDQMMFFFLDIFKNCTYFWNSSSEDFVKRNNLQMTLFSTQFTYRRLVGLNGPQALVFNAGTLS